jgi:EAL domain-containing protein (putative c-di-GMP-specific phosphodiesterase class I)/GGDEF domain-containing protein
MPRPRLEFFAALRAGARRLTRERRGVALSALQAAGDLAYVWNTFTDRIEWLGDGTPVFGSAATESPVALGRDLQTLVNPQDLPARLKTVHDALLRGGTFTSTFRLRLPDGSFHWVSDKGAVDIDSNGAKRIRGVFRALDERPVARPATASVPSAFAAAFAPHEEESAGLVVAFAVDHLDVITQAFGAVVASALIETVRERCSAVLGPQTAVISIGRGSFAFAVRGEEETVLYDRVEALRAALRDETIETAHGHLHVTVSLGMTPFAGGAEDAVALLAHAESALTQARLDGRDRCVIAAAANESATQSRTLLLRAEQVLNAIHRDAAFFAYQPIVDRSGKPVFHECLLRLRAPDGGLVPAGVFIPAVEALGLHAAVDSYVVARVLAELAEAPRLRLSCNISSLSLAEGDFRAELEERIAAAPEAARRLVIEITETAALPQDDALIACFEHLRAHGVKLALDDFGAGFTSLRHFTSLPLDIVKLDGSLVRAMSETRNGAAVVRSLVDLAAQFGFTLVAEGVEYGAEAEALRRLGVDYLQGYHCGRPVVEPPWRAAREERAASVA